MARLGSSRPLHTLLVALLAALAWVVPASAVTPAESVRLAQIPFLPVDATVSEVPDAVLISTAPQLQQPISEGKLQVAGRDFTSGGVTISREFVMTSDDPSVAEGFLRGFSNKQNTSPVHRNGVTVWKSIPSTDGTVAADAVVAVSDGNVAALQVSAELGLSQDQLEQIGQGMRARLATAAPASVSPTHRGPGSPVVSLLVIALGVGLVAFVFREGRAAGLGFR